MLCFWYFVYFIVSLLSCWLIGFIVNQQPQCMKYRWETICQGWHQPFFPWKGLCICILFDKQPWETMPRPSILWVVGVWLRLYPRVEPSRTGWTESETCLTWVFPCLSWRNITRGQDVSSSFLSWWHILGAFPKEVFCCWFLIYSFSFYFDVILIKRWSGNYENSIPFIP